MAFNVNFHIEVEVTCNVLNMEHQHKLELQGKLEAIKYSQRGFKSGSFTQILDDIQYNVNWSITKTETKI